MLAFHADQNLKDKTIAAMQAVTEEECPSLIEAWQRAEGNPTNTTPNKTSTD